MQRLDSLVHGLLLVVSEQLGEVRASNGQSCQYTVAVAGDETLEGGSVREGRCGLAVEAGGQKLVMIQARPQSKCCEPDRGAPERRRSVDVSPRWGCRKVARRSMRGTGPCSW